MAQAPASTTASPTGTGSGGSQTEFSTRPWPVAADPAKSKEAAMAAITARLDALKARLTAAATARREAGLPALLDPADLEALSGKSTSEKLEMLRVRLATRLDEDALAALNAAVTELAALEGHVAVTTPAVASPAAPHHSPPAPPSKAA